MNKTLAKRILAMKEVVKLIKPDILDEDVLNKVGIPINACKMCILKCGSCGIRCNYFMYHYDRSFGTYTPNEGFNFHNIPEEILKEIQDEEIEEGITKD